MTKNAASLASDKTEEFDKLIYHITHDIRASMRAMKTLPQWIREDLAADGIAIGENLEDTLQMLEQQSSRADQMLVDLRTFSRVGKSSDSNAVISLKSSMQSAAATVGLPNGFRLDFDLEVHAINGPVADCSLLFQTIVSNVFKHHDLNYGVILFTSRKSEEMVVLSVLDDGPGIPVEYRDKVFEMMSTLKPRDACEGSGLGLAIARKIVRQLGGSIQVGETDANRGTCIEIELPVHRATISTIT